MRALLLAAFCLFAVPSSASARVQEDLPWTYTQVFQSSIRLVRVDLGCAITERDSDAGFLLFDYESSGRIHHGSIEFAVTNTRDGRETIRVVVQLPTLPTYVERMIVTRLERKLRDEIGPPPRVVRRRPPEVVEAPEEGESEPAEPGEPPST